MALKKIERSGPLKSAGGLKKLEGGGIAKQRMLNRALDFVGDAPDVLADVEEGDSPEATHGAIIDRLDHALNDQPSERDASTIKADLKRQGDAYKNQGLCDYYVVVCFADGDATTEFLKKLGYPDPNAVFVDGHVLASLANIELPKPKFRLQHIRPPQKNLERLVTAFPKKD
jgi:prepilin-type processing-associated H-X9-DG protein